MASARRHATLVDYLEAKAHRTEAELMQRFYQHLWQRTRYVSRRHADTDYPRGALSLAAGVSVYAR